EAYTLLYSVWKDPLLAQKLRDLIDIFRHKILDTDTWHFQLFFDLSWNSKERHISFGHDIEGSWLLCRAAEVLGDIVLQKKVARDAVQIAQAVYLKGLNSQYGLIYGSDGRGELNLETHFWCQAEAVVGFLNAFQLSGQSHFLESAWKTWQFIENHQVDKESGEWFWKLDEQLRPDRSMPKISEWKCPYHNSRACIEVIQRLNDLLHEPIQKKRTILSL
ncbi:MAG: AGE family epimerase/isomerase, partial [Desulfobacterales bacterium]